MKRFSIRTLLILIAIFAIYFWWSDDGYGRIYSEVSPKHGELVIFGKPNRSTGEYRVRIRFNPKNGRPDEYHFSSPLIFPKPVEKPIEFFSLIDQSTGTWVICDKHNHGLVVMVMQKPASITKSFRQVWHPGIHIGWLRGLWAGRFRSIKHANEQVPYDKLPGEMKIAVE